MDWRKKAAEISRIFFSLDAFHLNEQKVSIQQRLIPTQVIKYLSYKCFIITFFLFAIKKTFLVCNKKNVNEKEVQIIHGSECLTRACKRLCEWNFEEKSTIALLVVIKQKRFNNSSVKSVCYGQNTNAASCQWHSILIMSIINVHREKNSQRHLNKQPTISILLLLRCSRKIGYYITVEAAHFTFNATDYEMLRYERVIWLKCSQCCYSFQRTLFN